MTAERTVVVVPGRRFGPHVPQLFFPMFAAHRRGARSVVVEWDADAPTDPVEIVDWVGERVEPVISSLDPASTVLVAKSLGTYCAALPATQAIPAIWVTPVLTVPQVAEPLRDQRAPFMLVGGTADELWDGPLARQLTDHVVEFEGADHGLFVPGPLERSAQNIAHLADQVETFLDLHVWPQDVDIRQ